MTETLRAATPSTIHLCLLSAGFTARGALVTIIASAVNGSLARAIGRSNSLIPADTFQERATGLATTILIVSSLLLVALLLWSA
ncbi:hypothetical protein [Leifsonia sp. 22587]|uniref:hypothetical protein n=1 Tax=Leifsonia sp. 22587 TaxID=3453946 RepID=UPI003F849584